MDEVDNCKLCFNTFADKVRPHCLPCGHSFCSSCINNLIEEEKLACPKCKLMHKANAFRDFPINYDLEELISNCKDMSLQQETTLRSGKMQSMITELKTNTQTILAQSEELEAEMKDYDNFLLERKTKHDEILKKILSLSNRNDAVMCKIEDEHKNLEAKRREVSVLRERVKTKLLSFDTGTDTMRTVGAIAELDHCVAALEEWNEMSKNRWPDAKLVSSSLKVLVDSTSAMSIVDSCSSDDEPDVPDLSQLQLTILEKVEKISGNGTINFQKLKVLSAPLRKLLEDGKVYAVQQKQGNTRSARLSINEEVIYLHHLQDGEIPPHIHTINHSEVINNLNMDSTVVFMDLAWEGSVKGRVHILLHHDTPLAQQFRILCTAELGPCYVSTKFYTVGNKGSYMECLNGGDYQNNNGNGGASVIDLPKDGDCYIRQLREGIVGATQGIAEGPKNAQFYIITGVGNVLINYNNVFGEVQDGMDVLKAAVSVPLGQVIIQDCGVKLPIEL